MADGQALADPQAEALEQDGIDSSTFVAMNGRREREPIRQGYRSHQGILEVHALDFDQDLLRAVRSACHGPHGRGLADATLLPKPCPLLAFGGTVRTRQCHIPADEGFALPREARAQSVGKRTDAGDDGDTQGHAGDENIKALKAVALLAQRQAEHQREPAAERLRL